MKKTIVYLGFGSNLGNRIENIQRAVQMLIEENKLMLICLSNFYDNPPLGNLSQPNYINAVGMFVTKFSPFELLDQTQFVESKLGRSKVREHWASRPIDIDILIYDNVKINSDNLVIPIKKSKIVRLCCFPFWILKGTLRSPD